MADRPGVDLVGNNSMGIVGNNSMGLVVVRQAQGVEAAWNVPVIGALVRLTDGHGRPIPGVSMSYSASGGTFRLVGVPVGQIAVVDASHAVRGVTRLALAIVAPAGSRTDVLVDVASSVAAARALFAARGDLGRIDARRVADAAAELRQRPEDIQGIDMGSLAALASGRPSAVGGARSEPGPADGPGSSPPLLLSPAPEPRPDLAPTPSPTAVPPPAPAPAPTPAPVPGPTPTPDDRFDLPLGFDPDAGVFLPVP